MLISTIDSLGATENCFLSKTLPEYVRIRKKTRITESREDWGMTWDENLMLFFFEEYSL